MSLSGANGAGGARTLQIRHTAASPIQEGELTLAGAHGHYQAPGSFSPDESLIAVSEFPNQVGVWRTDTGELVARVLMPVSLEGAQVDGATGLAAGILSFAAPHPDGWTLGEPV